MGLHTNVAFLRRVVGSRAFATADLDTALIERERAALFEAPPLPLEWPPPAVVAHAAGGRGARWRTPTPGRAATAGACTAARSGRFDLEVQGTRPDAWRWSACTTAPPCCRSASSAGPSAPARWAARATTCTLGERRVAAHGLRAGRAPRRVRTDGGSALVNEFDPIAHAGDGAAEGGRLTAPMPGKVVAFLAKAGDARASAARRWR